MYKTYSSFIGIEVTISFVVSNAFQYFIDAFNTNKVANYSISSIKFDMELKSSKGNIFFYGCLLDTYVDDSNNSIDCIIQSDHCVYGTISENDYLRQERIQKLKEIFNGEL